MMKRAAAKKTTPNPILPRHQRIRVAAEAGCDDRTIVRYLKGEAVWPAKAAAIASALKKLGLAIAVLALLASHVACGRFPLDSEDDDVAVLQKQNVTVTLKGLNQKAPGTIAVPGTLEVADNLRIARDEQGAFELVRRNSLTEIADTVAGAGLRLFGYGGAVLAMTGSTIERYQASQAAFSTVPPGGSASAAPMKILKVGRSDIQVPTASFGGAQTPTQSNLDAAVVSRLLCFAWINQSGAAQYLLRDSVSGTVVASGIVAASGATNTKIVALGSTFFLFWKAANAIVATTISSTSPYTAAAPTTVIAAGSALAGTDYDIQTGFDATHIALMYRSDATHHVRALLTTAFAVSTSVTDAVAADQPDVAMCWIPQDVFGASLFYGTLNSGTGLAKIQTIDKGTLAITATGSETFASPVGNLTGIVVAGTPSLVYEGTNVGGTLAYHRQVRVGVTQTHIITGVGLASRAFYIGGNPYAVCLYNSDSTATVLQDTYFIADLLGSTATAPSLPGKLLPSQGRRLGTLAVSSAPVDADGIVHVLGGHVISAEASTGAQLVLKYGLSDLRVSLPTSAIGAPLSFAGVGLIPGGQLFEVDADVSPHEQGFVIAPEPLVLAEGGGGSGSISPGTRSYLSRWKWVDSNGNSGFSATGTPVAITTVNANSSVQINRPSVPVSHGRSYVEWQVFSTPVGGDGTEYFRVSPAVETSTQNGTGGVLLIDTHSEASLASSEPFIPSSVANSELDNVAPPPLTVVIEHKNRAFGIDATRPSRIWFSKEYTPGTSIGFTDAFFIDTPESTGDAYSLASMDGHLIILKKETAYVVDGDFPDATGGGPAIPLPYLLPTGVGSDQPRSVIVSQLGTAFYSSLKGFWLINRSLQAQYIGGPVETAAAGQTISGASIHPTYTEIRWTSEGGTTFVLNTYETEKTGAPVWTTFSGQACVSSMSFNGDWYLLTAAGKLLKEDLTRWQDGVALNGGAFTAGTAYTTKARISDINFAGIGGLARVWRGQLLGQWYDSHKVKITLTLNHRSVAGQVFTFDATSDPDPYQLEFRLNAFEQKQTSVDVTIEDTTDFQRRAFAWTALMFSVGVKPGLYRMGQGHTMTGS